MYAIVDIETTGGSPRTGRVTEIAVFVHDGREIIDIYSTLVNPRMPIASFVTGLTGITNEMVADAPDFEDIADEIDRITANRILVAHNAVFDYEVLRSEFRRMGRDFKRKWLCTVQQSRKAFPQLASYSLGNLTRELDIPLENHHRATDDARATTYLLEHLLKKLGQVGLFAPNMLEEALKGINSTLINRNVLMSIPEETGIFSFYDASGDCLYVKRNRHLRTGILEKLEQNEVASTLEIKKSLYSIDFTPTGSELLAALMEVRQIVETKPSFNKGKSSSKYPARIVAHQTETGYEFRVEGGRRHVRGQILAYFTSSAIAARTLEEVAEKLDITVKPQIETVDNKKRHHFPSYLGDNLQKKALKEMLNLTSASFAVVDLGRSQDEKTLIFVDRGVVKGFRFLQEEEQFDEEEIKAEAEPLPDHLLIRALIRDSLEKDPFLKKIPLKYTH